MPATTPASLALYREALRTISKFPVPNLRPKLRYNVRHAFELYRGAPAADLPRLHAMAHHDFQVLAALNTLGEKELHKLFRGQDVSISPARSSAAMFALARCRRPLAALRGPLAQCRVSAALKQAHPLRHPAAAATFAPIAAFAPAMRAMSTSSPTSQQQQNTQAPADPAAAKAGAATPLASPPADPTSATPSRRGSVSASASSLGKLDIVHENIYTIPNAMSFARLLSTPALGYLIVQGKYDWALGLFAVSAVTDMLDGFIARNLNMRSVLGTILDPMADKALMTTLTVSLGWAGLIPLPLAALIIGRDAGLVVASFFIRYKSLPPPKTISRFWDFSLPSAEVRPTLISKANTALQLLYVGAALSAPALAGAVPAVAAAWAVAELPLQAAVATTTVWSGLSYVYSKDAVRYLHQDEEMKKKQQPPSEEKKSE
ncbi:hypothetical protein H9P43_004246 [Blastocladiella emersonii ATCC 22665]|nr:hypothetical protein H9P43_004246 [Blastocladiella emersonii ATCC 22665]